MNAYVVGLVLLTCLMGSWAFAQSTDPGQGDPDLAGLVRSEDRSPENIRRIQESLKTLGYDPGPVDGQMGQKIRAALKAWNKKQTPPLSLEWTQPQRHELNEVRSHELNEVRIGKGGRIFLGPGTDDCPGGFQMTSAGPRCDRGHRDRKK